MEDSDNHGFKEISALAENSGRIRRLKEESGKPVIGYLCCFAPPEMISAAGALPFRLTGIPGGDTSDADAYIEPYGCPYARNILARAARGDYNFLDGLVIPHSCDMIQRLYGIWTYYHPLPYSYLFNVPHQLTPWAQRFYKRELGFFKESLEKFTGQEITDTALRKEIESYNHNRTLIRDLYALRHVNPPLIKGSEILNLLLAGGALPAENFSSLLETKLTEIRQRQKEKTAGPRILVWGSILDDPALYLMIEKAGGSVVADDTCIGMRLWEKNIPLPIDLYNGFLEQYFIDFQCPRTDRGPGVKRFNYLLERIDQYDVDGVVGYIISFCDPHKFDYPDLRDLLKKEGIPMLLIDDNYSFEPAEAVMTRIEAFIELL